MTKFKITKILSKNKLVCISSLLLTTSIISPLTSCGSDGSSNDIGGFDKEFGFDVQTYNRLENEFINKYKNQLLDDNNIDKNVAFDKFDNFLQNDITFIRNKLFDPAQNYSFTVRTNTLMDYASKNYNIYLNRNSDVGETDFTNLKKSSLENFVSYINNLEDYEDSQKQLLITNFSNKFDQLLAEIKSKYSDNTEILMKLRASVIDCWDGLSYEFSYLSAYNHLKDFFDDYEFVIKDQSNKLTDNNKLLWNNLLNDEQFITNGKTGQIDQDIDCPITDQWINNLFTFCKKKNYGGDNYSTNQQDDSASDIPAGYSEIYNFNSEKNITGYTLTPVLKMMSQDIYANKYYMSIDWQLISNKYKDETNQEIRNKVTAHLAHNVDETNSDQQFSSNDYTFIDYQLLSTPTYEKNNLKKAYFTDSEPGQNIVFSWDQDKTPLEQFFPSDINYQDEEPMIIKNQYDVSMNQKNLSNAHLKVNDKFLSDLLIKEGEFPHSQDNISTNDKVNNDDHNSTMPIEEKFVHNCEIIKATSNVTFYNNNSNKISTVFTVCYCNSQENKSSDVANKAEVSDIKLSNNFCDDAVGYYNDVNNYTDSQQIETKSKKACIHSSEVKFYLCAMAALLFITFIAILIIRNWTTKYNFQKSNSDNPLIDSIRNNPLIAFAILLAFVAILSITWYCTIDRPINEYAEKVNKWNKALKNDDAFGNLNVLKKIKEDKENFASVANFQKFFQSNRSKAYSSYWYYLHFNNMQKNNNNEKAKQVIDDYNAFYNTWKKYLETSDKKILKVCLNVLFIIVLILVFAFFVIIICSLYTKYDAVKKLAKAKNNIRITTNDEGYYTTDNEGHYIEDNESDYGDDDGQYEIDNNQSKNEKNNPIPDETIDQLNNEYKQRLKKFTDFSKDHPEISDEKTKLFNEMNDAFKVYLAALKTNKQPISTNN